MSTNIVRPPAAFVKIGKFDIKSVDDIPATSTWPKIDPLLMEKLSSSGKKLSEIPKEGDTKRPSERKLSKKSEKASVENFSQVRKTVTHRAQCCTQSDHAITLNTTHQKFRRSLSSMGLQAPQFTANKSVELGQIFSKSTRSSSRPSILSRGTYCDGDVARETSVVPDVDRMRSSETETSAGFNKTGSGAWDVWCLRKREQDRQKREAKKKEEALMVQRRVREIHYEKECEKQNYRLWLQAKEAQRRRVLLAQKIKTGG